MPNFLKGLANHITSSSKIKQNQYKKKDFRKDERPMNHERQQESHVDSFNES